MSATVCTKQNSFTDSELNAPYAASPSLLPNTANGASDRESTGMLKDSVLTSIVTSLMSNKVIPNSTTLTPEAYATQQSTFIINVKAEYCYYESRYYYALNQLFTAISNGYTANTTANKATIQRNLIMAQGFNQRLNDMIQVMNQIVKTMLNASSTISSDITKYNTELQEKQKKLDEQNRVISSNEAGMKIKKQMVKYTEEKARSTNNLLNLYAFLNVVTIGLLVYVYKAAGDQ